MEEQKAQEQDKQSQEEKQPQETKPEEDLVTRVSQLKKTETVPEVDVKEPEFDFKDIENIKDPEAREQAIKAYKSFQKGFGNKFQELASLKKELESLRQEGHVPKSWTPDRVQELLKDPTFVESARSIAESSNKQVDDNSMLTETEKQELKEMRDKIKTMESQAWQTHKAQQDEALKAKYANYDAQGVDIITKDLLTGKRQATREDLWKALDYENAIQRAYKLGKEDRKLEVTEKKETSSIGETAVTGNRTPPPQEKGESDRAYFKRLGERNLAELVSKKK